jgi:hypothetical protein
VYSAIVTNAVNIIAAVITKDICLYIKMLTTKKYIRIVSNLFLYKCPFSLLNKDNTVTYLFIRILLSYRIILTLLIFRINLLDIAVAMLIPITTSNDEF